MNVIETERLFARKWKADDIDHAQKIWGDAKVMLYLNASGAMAPDQVQKKLSEEIEREQKFGVQYWPFFERASGKLIGCGGLKPWVHSTRQGWELGFYLVPEMWGMGYAFELGKAALAFANRSGFKPVLAGHHPENVNSQKILLKLGFKFLENVLFKPTGLRHPSYSRLEDRL